MKPNDKIDLDEMSAEKLEILHDEMHTRFNQMLSGKSEGWTFRQISNAHYAIYKALIRAGGKHISPIDQLDNLEMLAEDSGKNKGEILIKDMKGFDPSKSNDKELLEDHNVTHKWRELLKTGKNIKLLNGKKMTCEIIKGLHDKIVKEMLKRKIPHDSPIYCESDLAEKNQFVLKRYFGDNDELRDLWGIKLKNKSFEMKENPLKKGIIISIKKNLELKGKIIDQGEFEILEENENLLIVNFKGEELREILNFKRNSINSHVWKLSKKDAKEELSREFGSTLSNEEIISIHFLSENKVGASEIANILSRPVQTIYSWIGKLKY